VLKRFSSACLLSKDNHCYEATGRKSTNLNKMKKRADSFPARVFAPPRCGVNSFRKRCETRLKGNYLERQRGLWTEGRGGEGRGETRRENSLEGWLPVKKLRGWNIKVFREGTNSPREFSSSSPRNRALSSPRMHGTWGSTIELSVNRVAVK